MNSIARHSTQPHTLPEAPVVRVAARSAEAREPSHQSSITELVLTQHSPDEHLLLLPMVAHLSRITDRWITWVSPTRIDKSLLTSFGVDTNKIRLIQCDTEEDRRWILWEALSTGTSHTVIAAPGALSAEALSHLESAAHKGNSRGLLIRYR